MIAAPGWGHGKGMPVSSRKLGRVTEQRALPKGGRFSTTCTVRVSEGCSENF